MAERKRIQLLPESVISKIAAGEIIERPASVVKELVENAIDSGAQNIEVDIGEGGRRFIAVSDDGCGMTLEEARLALQRHSTSKIQSADDLEKIQTLGFRGEALASISAVSQMDLLTRVADSGVGSRLHCEAGILKSHEPFGTPTGTTVNVANLFFNTPARLKFLKSNTTELSHIENVIKKSALSEIHRSFLLQKKGEVVLHLPQAKTIFDRLSQLYDRSVMEKLIPMNVTHDGIELDGFISTSPLSFSRASEIWFFVNGRPVRDRTINAAILEGYRASRMEKRYPLVVLQLKMPPTAVDVNVHPTKAEVRFSNSQQIFRAISQSIAKTLEAGAGITPVPLSGAPLAAREQAESYTPQQRPVQEREALSFSYQEVPMSTFNPPSSSLPLDPPSDSTGFSSLQYLADLDRTYLVCRDQESVVIIDQHAAHERVKFEELKKNMENEDAPTRKQELLLPLTMDVSAKQAEILEKTQGFLERLGFDIEPFGPQSFVIKSVPTVLGTQDPRPLISELVEDFLEKGDATAWKDKKDEILSQIACHSAVRAHDSLSSQEIRSLLGQLDDLDQPGNCPHGRPTFLRFTLSDLERMFRRR